MPCSTDDHGTVTFLLSGLLVVWISACPGCNKTAAPESRRPAVVIISGDTQGWIVPCGCTSNQSGGLLRRGAYLHDLRATTDVLYLDAGGAAAGNSIYQQAKLAAIFAGEHAMDIAAHNLGKSELSIDTVILQKLAAAAQVPLLSANTTASDGQPIAPDIRIIPLAGHRIAVIGVISPNYTIPSITITDPRHAITTTIAAHRDEFDSLIILAYMPQQELEQLAAATPEADAIIGGPTGQAIAPHRAGAALLASATNKGKFIVRLPVPEKSAPWEGQVVELNKTYADDPTQSANLASFLQTLKDREIPAAESGFVPAVPAQLPAGYRIAGSSTCIICHTDAGKIWVRSLHAAAGKALEPRHFEVDPDCLRCHTTGYALPGGFVSPKQTPRLYGVGCENCHGPSQAHASNPSVHTQYAAFDQCIRCHDEENSPKFDRVAYWQIVRHGPATQPTAIGAAP
jgi:hypothetical protein